MRRLIAVSNYAHWATGFERLQASAVETQMFRVWKRARTETSGQGASSRPSPTIVRLPTGNKTRGARRVL